MRGIISFFCVVCMYINTYWHANAAPVGSVSNIQVYDDTISLNTSMDDLGTITFTSTQGSTTQTRAIQAKTAQNQVYDVSFTGLTPSTSTVLNGRFMDVYGKTQATDYTNTVTTAQLQVPTMVSNYPQQSSASQTSITFKYRASVSHIVWSSKNFELRYEVTSSSSAPSTLSQTHTVSSSHDSEQSISISNLTVGTQYYLHYRFKLLQNAKESSSTTSSSIGSTSPNMVVSDWIYYGQSAESGPDPGWIDVNYNVSVANVYQVRVDWTFSTTNQRTGRSYGDGYMNTNFGVSANGGGSSGSWNSSTYSSPGQSFSQGFWHSTKDGGSIIRVYYKRWQQP